MTSALQDLRAAWRSLRSTPAVATVAIVILAVGAGLSTTVHALVYGVLVRPLPYPEPSRLALVPVGGRNDPDEGIALSTFEDWQTRMRLVDSIAAYATTRYTLRGLGEPSVVQAALVTARFFDVLNVRPLVGRSLGPKDSAVVVSERLVRKLRTSAHDLVGQSVMLADRLFSVVGVMPDAVAFPSDRVDLWVRAEDAPAIELFRGEDARRFRLVARTASGVLVSQVRDDARRVLAELQQEQPHAFRHLVASAEGLQDRLVAPVRPILLVFVIGAALVLFVACANAGSLLLSRAVSREREIAVRLALGAGRVRVVRAVLAEAVLIALAGAALGATVAIGAVRILGRLAAGTLPRLQEVAIDFPVLLASLATAGLVALVCGTAPAVHALRTNLAPAFRQAGASRTRHVGHVTGALVVAQIAASVVLLIGAGLLTRTVIGLLRVDLGIEPRNALATTLLLTDTIGFDAAARKPFIADLTRELRGLPGVRHAGVGSSFPPDSSMVDVEFRIISEGREEHSGLIGLASVTPGYFGALSIPLLAGRLLEEGDADARYPVAVVSRSVARTLFASRDPIGRTLPARLPGVRADPPRIVGIVGDVRYTGLEAPAGGTIYIPWEDLPVGVVHLAVRTAGNPVVMAPAIRRAIHKVDSAQPVGNIRPVEAVIAGAVADRRLQALLISVFGGLALVLAVFGLVAGVTRAVGERQREIAIRTALGSTPGRTVKLVVANSAVLLILGITAGIATAALAAGGLAEMVYGLSPRDPLTYSVATAIVAFTGLVGCYFPARQAARISPAEVLRSE